ncbi:hypothetical protein APR08_006550 [Nocardia amikacinitolerans]|nr:hypothetical protein [Nocardia amikacinitolerans]
MADSGKAAQGSHCGALPLVALDGPQPVSTAESRGASIATTTRVRFTSRDRGSRIGLSATRGIGRGRVSIATDSSSNADASFRDCSMLVSDTVPPATSARNTVRLAPCHRRSVANDSRMRPIVAMASPDVETTGNRTGLHSIKVGRCRRSGVGREAHNGHKPRQPYALQRTTFHRHRPADRARVRPEMAPLSCQDVGCRSGLFWLAVGLGCDLSEVPVWGVEPVALESAAGPDCPPGLAVSRLRWSSSMRAETTFDMCRFNARIASIEVLPSALDGRNRCARRWDDEVERWPWCAGPG